MQEFLALEFLGNTVKSYLFFIGTIVIGIVVLAILKNVVIKRLAAKAKRTQTDIDEMLTRAIDKYLLPILYLIVIYLSLHYLTINTNLLRIIDIVIIAFGIIFGALLLSSVAIVLFNRFWQKKKGESDPMALRWIAVILRILIWGAALLLFLENIGVEITALVAGLGIGGIAIAFAAQAILEDIFSFVTIFFDRPFEIGDYITIGDMMGTVEHIGIKTTRIRSLSGEQLVFANKDLTNSRLRNYKRMESRRISFGLGVTYDTPLEKLKAIPDIIKDIITNLDGAEFVRAHFFEYADYSLNYQIVYIVQSQDYAVYMDIQQEINFKIKEEFDKHGISFAFPTQTLYVHSSKSERSAE